MATHSKICPIRAFTPPLSSQNRRNLENPFPLTYPYVRPLREKGCRFYNHFGFAHEPFLAHLTIIWLAVMRSLRRNVFYVSAVV